MSRIFVSYAGIVALATGLIGATTNAFAQKEVEDFYRGRSMSLII